MYLIYTRIFQNFQDLKVHCRVHKSPKLVSSLNQTNPVHKLFPISRKFILILSDHLRLGLHSGLFHFDFRNNILYAFLPVTFQLHALSFYPSGGTGDHLTCALYRCLSRADFISIRASFSARLSRFWPPYDSSLGLTHTKQTTCLGSNKVPAQLIDCMWIQPAQWDIIILTTDRKRDSDRDVSGT
jgi:hypothetical protein